VAKKFLIALSWALGVPTYTDEVKKLIAWDVMPRKELNVKNTTFSQRDWEAELHTDTQYYPSPEKYVMLACYHEASDGWNTTLIDGKVLFEDINTQDPDLFLRLSSLKVPFRVPSSFTRSGTDESIELYFSSIFSKEVLIRYRKETIEKWLVFLLQEEQDKLNELIVDFEYYLWQKGRTLEFWLEANDILICNNHEYLHWRTHFTDPERLLFRIRFN
jgi:alpha-ketoglutarate-dependent taurine dioxygenase